MISKKSYFKKNLIKQKGKLCRLTVSKANTLVSYSTVSNFIIQIRVGITEHLKTLYDSQKEY